MANTRDDFNNKNPNGILSESNRARTVQTQRQFEEQLERESSNAVGRILANLEAEKKTIKDITERQERLSGIIKNVDDERAKLIQEQINRLEEERDVAVESYESLKVFSDLSVEKYKEKTAKINKARDELNALDELERSVMADDSLTFKEKKNKLKDLDIDNERRARENLIRKEQGKNSIEFDNIVEFFGGKDKGIGSILNNVVGEDATMSAISDVADLFGDTVGDVVPQVKIITEVVKQVASIVGGILEALDGLRKEMTESINNAASTMASYYGPIRANLEGSEYSWESLEADIDKSLGLNRFVKQTDYLNEISSLTSEGLINDIEQRAILETIKNKTLTSFDVRDAALTRLIRLGEQDSLNQFGIELQLKRLLNNKVFGDSSYLRGLFDSVSAAIIDAGVVGKSDISNFNSTVQTFLGAMYAQGISDNVVSSIAQGINALGSGNVQALAQDESIQRLFLLSMDRIGMDYADILQQGLSSNDTAKLLSSVIEYLAEIAGNTKDNLVLRSSYSSLFNMSVSDMQAIQNVSKNLSTITSGIISSNQAQDITTNAVSKIVAQNTLASEQFDNFLSNFSYSFGSNIAEDNKLYTTYRIADLTYNMLDKIGSTGGPLGKAISYAKIAPALIQYGIGFKGFLPLLTEMSSVEEGSLAGLLNEASTAGAISSTERSNSLKRFASEKNEGKSFRDVIGGILETEEGAWKDAKEENESLDELKKITKALMKLKEGDGYAFAVSLEGMNDSVLRSFASIFADEDAMLSTFQGDNKVLEDALFNYLDDTTSNSTNAK